MATWGNIFALPVSDPQFPSFRYDGWRLEANGGSEKNPAWFHRISSDSLLHLLKMPLGQPPVVLTKAGKPRVRQPPPVKEQRPGFYPAQMMLYGVKPVRKTTPAAKALLLDAFAELPAGANLQIPTALTDLEQRLKDIFTKVNAEEKQKREEENERRKKLEADELQRRLNFEQELAQQIAQVKVEAVSRKGKKRKLDSDDKLGFINSRFTCVVPEITEQWPEDLSLTLRLVPSSTRTHIWGKFELGIVRGYLRAKPISSRPGTFSFVWRGRVGESDECSYIDDHNNGELEFLNDGLINGWIQGDCFGHSKLMGKRTGPLCPSTHIQRFVIDWKKAFRSINDDEYEPANIARWGFWAPDPPPGKKDASDTDAGDSLSGSGNDDDDDEGAGWSAKRRAPSPSFAASISVNGGRRTKQTARKSTNVPARKVTSSDSEWPPVGDRSADWQDGYEAGYKRGLQDGSGAY
ncbi:hypothetical protein BDZ88DRAFT_431525 [Geranomyces variabilis]|nr:hypothetical protein BDZ88DRAFT_431525 [Geranomyces variabilis]KAJ3131631.1 hypothetical protein HDU90_008153 [Geranomyces variabilis]